MNGVVDAQEPLGEGDPGQRAAPKRTPSVASGTAWGFTAQVAPLVINLLLTPVVITNLGPVNYGLFLITSTLTQFLGQFDGGIARVALSTFSLLAGTDDRKHTTEVLTSFALAATVLSVTVMGAVVLGAERIASFFQAPSTSFDDVTFLLRVLAVLVAVLMVRSLFFCVLAARSRFAVTSGTILLSYVVYAIGTVYAVTNGYGLRGLAWVFVAQQALATLVIVPAAMRYLTASGIGLVGRTEAKQLASLAWKVQFNGVLTLATFQGSLLLVGRLAPQEVPHYGPGSTFAFQIRQLMMNAVNPIQARMGSALGASGSDMVLAGAGRVQHRWVVICTGVAAVGAPASYFGVNAWLPLEGSFTGLVAALLIISHAFGLLPVMLYQWKLLHKEPRVELIAGIISAGGIVLGSLALTPLIGALGVCLAALASNLAALVFASARSGALPAPIRSVPVVAAVISGVVTYVVVGAVSSLVTGFDLPTTAIALIACGLAAAPVLYLFLLATLGRQGRRLDPWLGFRR